MTSNSKELIERLVRDAYEEGVGDGIEWGMDPSGEPKPQWIDSVARVELLRATQSPVDEGGSR